ncbi:MAG TPA: tRNA pseudouridine(55) synthase TruB [Gemmatimonadales bacterium]
MDKPPGLTSHDVVQQVRRGLGTRAAGHTGTLDPFATGLLVVLLGRATRLAQFVQLQPKTYLATACLGVRTTTDDTTGRVVQTSESGRLVPEDRIREALAAFEGSQRQQPPQYSAKHVAGERSYTRARRGEAVELPDVSIIVHRIALVQYQPPELSFRVVVSSGTYIRAIARDLGECLGVGGHLTALRREAIGSLRVEDAVTLERLSPTAVLPPGAILRDLPSVDLDESARRDVVHGRAVVDGGKAGRRGSGEAIALVVGNGELVAVARAEAGWLRPMVVLEAL